ncbi:uncharacterized protein AMSG_06929 [Thecamonas trahens ATCC 50062]|uniref:Calponin-homology (CH) domain-containing protein n=1 Tax=Thecamonas trahens ATCC 50062 TaxID=461836 RepID=A0A0L0DGG7_THETB|nr:hypothetical protein AMSG_06929 [Thecamonas trahens ATCC 50062]KNC50433.1 hypothetical protein AMSG_06929 [Thecamonas trahens ATCC 50062]|eukprot:XP_013756973.1 hypothetical protein AMSG_06929 [Thecamonas trahens ATCC 50062]
MLVASAGVLHFYRDAASASSGRPLIVLQVRGASVEVGPGKLEFSLASQAAIKMRFVTATFDELKAWLTALVRQGGAVLVRKDELSATSSAVASASQAPVTRKAPKTSRIDAAEAMLAGISFDDFDDPPPRQQVQVVAPAPAQQARVVAQPASAAGNRPASRAPAPVDERRKKTMANPIEAGATKAGSIELVETEGGALVFKKLFFEVVGTSLKFYSSGSAQVAKLYGKVNLLTCNVGLKTFANACENGFFVVPSQDPAGSVLWLNGKSVMSRREWLTAMIDAGATKTKFSVVEPLVSASPTYRELCQWASGKREGVRPPARVFGAAGGPTGRTGTGAPPPSTVGGAASGPRASAVAAANSALPSSAMLLNWINTVLASSSTSIRYTELERDMKGGIPVFDVLRVLTGESLPPYHIAPNTVTAQLENCTLLHTMLPLLGLKTETWSPADVVNASSKPVRRMVAAIRDFFDGGRYKPNSLTRLVASGKLQSVTRASGPSASSSGSTSAAAAAAASVTVKPADVLIDWANRILLPHKLRVIHLDDDFRDSLLFIKLIEELTAVMFPEHIYHTEFLDGAAKLDNATAVFERMRADGIKVGDLREADVMRGDITTVQTILSRIMAAYTGARDTISRDEALKADLTRWVNSKLAMRDAMWKVRDLHSDLADGIILMRLAEILTGRQADDDFTEKAHRKPERLANLKLIEGMFLNKDVPHEGWSMDGVVVKDPLHTNNLIITLKNHFGE